MRAVDMHLVENKNEECISSHLSALVERYSDIGIASAFIARSGLDLIEGPLLRGLDEGRITRVRFITGTYLWFTEPAALERLQRLESKYPGRVVLRVVEGEFHKKLYVFRDGTCGRHALMIGSSNLTGNMFDADEACVEIRRTEPNTLLLEAWKAFERDFKNGEPIDEQWLEVYRKKHRHASRARARFPRRPVGPTPKPAKPRIEPGARLFLDSWNTATTEEERAAVRKQTNWQRKYKDKNWGWYCFDDGARLHAVDTGDQILVVDYAKASSKPQSAHLCEVLDTATLPLADGARYYIAYEYRIRSAIKLDQGGAVLAGYLRTIGVLDKRVRRLDKWRRVTRKEQREALYKWIEQHRGKRESL